MQSNGNPNFCWIEEISDELRPTYKLLETMCSSIKEDAFCYNIVTTSNDGIPVKSVRDYSEEDEVDMLIESSGEVKIINELDST